MYSLLVMDEVLPQQLFSGADGARLSSLVELPSGMKTTPLTTAPDDLLATTELLITGWGCPPLTTPMLQRLPALKAVIHAGGTVKGHLPPAAWQRGVVVASAAAANVAPVAEYALAMILLAGKGVPWEAASYRREGISDEPAYRRIRDGGNSGLVVGIIGASRIGRRVIELLKPFDIEILIFDPWLDQAQAHQLGVELCSLEDLARRSDVVSIHAPSLPETRAMVSAQWLSLLRPGATLINTARGEIVDQEALVCELSSGRINAILDVTIPEVLAPEHPLLHLPNVLVTPHLAGALGNELTRIGRLVVNDVERLIRGLPLAGAVHPHELAYIA